MCLIPTDMAPSWRGGPADDLFLLGVSRRRQQTVPACSERMARNINGTSAVPGLRCPMPHRKRRRLPPKVLRLVIGLAGPIEHQPGRDQPHQLRVLGALCQAQRTLGGLGGALVVAGLRLAGGHQVQ